MSMRALPFAVSLAVSVVLAVVSVQRRWPGHGKDHLREGSARLGWPFVELFPSRLAGDSPAGLAYALREAFALVAEMDKVVVYIDEEEEIAGLRQPRTVSVAQGATKEMLS